MSSDEDFSSGSSDLWQPPPNEDENNGENAPHHQRQRNVRPRGRYSRSSIEAKNMLIELYEEGLSITDAARRCKLNVSTAKSVICLYKKDGVVAPDRRGGRKTKKLTPQVLKYIEEILEQNNSITIRNIARTLRVDKNIALSKSTVHNGLIELKITLKLASVEMAQMNAPRTIELRQIYALEFPNWANNARDKIIFIDECGFNLHLRRSQARSRRGTRARVIVPTVRGRNVTLIAAITTQGVLHTNIITNSTCNSNKFCIFLRELAENVGQTQLRNGFLVMDNARIHKTQEVRDVVGDTELTIKFLPPYSPMLNPIEKCFSKLKSHARQVLSDNSRDHNLVDVIGESVAQVTINDCANYVMDMVFAIPQAAAGAELH